MSQSLRNRWSDRVSRPKVFTRKLCYRKDDRAMQYMGAMKIFGTPSVMTTPTDTIPNIFA